MAQYFRRRSNAMGVGLRGPFDDYPREDDEKKRLKAFLRRTGLHDYEQVFRVGAFLARRPPGDAQVEYIQQVRKEEDEEEEEARLKNLAESTVQQDLEDEFSEANEPKEDKEIRENHEDQILRKEGDKRRWYIAWRQHWQVRALVFCCSLGAVIQGWDETAINGAQLYYQGRDAFDIADSHAIVGFINSAPYLMCIFSCCLTGPLNRYLGRKGTIMFCCLFCFASCLGQAFCQTWRQLLVCRLLLGFGIGPKTATIPIYAAESVPSEEIRGALVMTWQLCTALGIMLGYIFTFIFKNLPGNLPWRLMVGSPMVAPAILFFLMMALPESPRWHLLKARRLERDRNPNRMSIVRHYDKAFHALCRLRYLKLQAARDLYTIDVWLRMDERTQLSLTSQDDHGIRGLTALMKASFPNLLTLVKDRRCRRAMTSGLIVLSLQQLCGVNTFAYYSSSVFKDSLTQNGQNLDHIALGYSLGFGGINFGLAIVALFLIDSVGRRLLLFMTFPLMSAFQFGTAFSFGKVYPVKDSWRHTLVVLFAYLFCGAYSIGEGPVPLVYASEILPLEVRDTGVGILTGIYWGLNSLMALTWPSMYGRLKPEGSFCFYGGLNLIGWVLVIFFVPETSRYKLEEVDQVFRKTTVQIMSSGWAQLKWLAGKKGRDSRRWVLKEYPVLVPRSNDRNSLAIEQEMDDRVGSVDSSEAINENSEAAKGYAVSPANGPAARRSKTFRDV